MNAEEGQGLDRVISQELLCETVRKCCLFFHSFGNPSAHCLMFLWIVLAVLWGIERNKKAIRRLLVIQVEVMWVPSASEEEVEGVT